MMTKLLKEFFRSEQAAGIVLIGCTAASLILANSAIGGVYADIWQAVIFGQTVSYWINDGLMTIFFLLVGLETERELYVGELSEPRKALLPIVAAVGGMVVPAAIHASLNFGLPTQSGFGIPMATDIAFALGVLALLGKRVPLSLKVFLTALAIIDDLGAILVIAVFYSTSLSLLNLGLAAVVAGILIACNRLRVSSLAVYLIGGIFLWHFIHQSGIHATISGVILAFIIPFREGDYYSPSFRLQHWLHYPVAFVVLPLFALANTSLTIEAGWVAALVQPNSLGIILGLLVGKPLGVAGFSLLGVKVRLLQLPKELRGRHIVAVSLLAGVGFTMSIFITLLAFGDPGAVQQSKVAILVASLCAGGAGYIVLRGLLPYDPSAENQKYQIQ
jgi:Na+:H+ antiporter, NhaA family